MAMITLKPTREKSLLRRHPWIFSGAIASMAGGPQSGETVLVTDANEQPMRRFWPRGCGEPWRPGHPWLRAAT